ncbi:MAG: hypothetical protein GAK38_02242 [Xylophilus sp.]|nr:MAG: hypothetical protein GAK38_02242 [Xylophilus sp.]
MGHRENKVSPAAVAPRLRVALAQTLVAFDARENGAQIRAFMRQAADAGARPIQFTEGAMSGYPSGPGKQALAPGRTAGPFG